MQIDSELSAALALLEAQLAADVEEHITPGFSVAVVHGQETIWARGFGYADLERQTRARPDTVYAVGSITKLFTTTMLMQLRDAGKLRLDDPVQAYLPEVKVPRRHPDGPEITFRHLVTHTSGLTKDAPLDYWDSRKVPPAERLMELLAETEQPYPPGRQWKYSNLGFALLGYTLARIAGQPWPAYVQQHILRPLGMRDSAPRLIAVLYPKVATGYARPVEGWPPAPIPYMDLAGISPGGGLHSTVVDMAKFIAEQFAPEPKLLKRSTVEEMHRIQWLNPDWQGGWCLGWSATRADDGTMRIGHGGAVYGFTCGVLLSPPDQLGVAVFTNGSDARVRLTVAPRVLDLLVPMVRRAAQRQMAPPAPLPASWQRYVGRYRWILGDMEVVVRDGRLVLLLPNGLVTDEVELEPEGQHVFRMPTGAVRGERLRFVLDGDGQVTRAWVGPHPYERV